VLCILVKIIKKYLSFHGGDLATPSLKKRKNVQEKNRKNFRETTTSCAARAIKLLYTPPSRNKITKTALTKQ
jgi:hypothetical protein